MIDTIVVHCSASPQDRGDDAETIHRWHLERGWDGIGYHAVILENGEIQRGRPDYWTGSHVRGHNRDSLGVCLIGEGGDATNEQLMSLLSIISEWKIKYPSAELFGHRDLDSKKTCPDFDVRSWWQNETDSEA